MAKRYAVTPVDTNYSPQVTKHSSSAVSLPEIFDSREEAEEFVRTASQQDTKRRYALAVNEIEVSEK